jgi:hypothetical protein
LAAARKTLALPEAPEFPDFSPLGWLSGKEMDDE